MKKITSLLIVFLLSFAPIIAYAYSDKIILGGETLGINIESPGVLIIGFYKIDDKYNKGTPQLKVGDLITKVNDKNITKISELTEQIESNMANNKVNITYLRTGKEYKTSLDLKYEDGVYKTGLYVKDSITGIGTLTYIDPSTLFYGALGHEIIESNSNSVIEVKSGSIFKSSITGIDKSSDGYPGSKDAKFYFKTKYGTINKNSEVGLFGKYTATLPNKELVEVANNDEVKIGPATIYTVLENEKVEEFSINITKINSTSKTKNIYFEIDDQKLLNKTGGIVQGMSGSPIMQNGKIIGAVTHVIIDNVQTGYGIFITTMLSEGENN